VAFLIDAFAGNINGLFKTEVIRRTLDGPTESAGCDQGVVP
jgi:hypothetical protein